MTVNLKYWVSSIEEVWWEVRDLKFQPRRRDAVKWRMLLVAHPILHIIESLSSNNATESSWSSFDIFSSCSFLCITGSYFCLVSEFLMLFFVLPIFQFLFVIQNKPDFFFINRSLLFDIKVLVLVRFCRLIKTNWMALLSIEGLLTFIEWVLKNKMSGEGRMYQEEFYWRLYISFNMFSCSIACSSLTKWTLYLELDIIRFLTNG